MSWRTLRHKIRNGGRCEIECLTTFGWRWGRLVAPAQPTWRRGGQGHGTGVCNGTEACIVMSKALKRNSFLQTFVLHVSGAQVGDETGTAMAAASGGPASPLAQL